MDAGKKEEVEQLKGFAHRHLKTCEIIYDTAIQRNDIDIAAHAARSAISVAFDSFKHLGDGSTRDDVFAWNERLSKLWIESAPALDYLNKAIKWSTAIMSFMFEPGEDSKIGQVY
jgi:hypothetical protein